MNEIPPKEPLQKDLILLSAAAADAERWLARWLREQSAADQPPDVRELNMAVTALRRLIDARKALRELERDDPERGDGRNNSTALEAQLCQALEHLEPGGEETGDPQTLPD